MTAGVSAKASGWADAQHARGRLTARERVSVLLDPGSVAEFGPAGTDGDGVVTVRGRIGGREVCVFAKDFGVAQGTLSQEHARRITELQDHALRKRTAIVGVFDTAGLRLESGITAWNGFADVARGAARAQGRVPQVSVILGPSPGADALLAALSDFVFMANDDGTCYLSGPEVVRAVTHEQVDGAQLGGSAVHAERSGLSDAACANDVEALLKVRRLIAFLPPSGAAPAQCLDDAERASPVLDTLVPNTPGAAFDVREAIREIADAHDFMELRAAWAANLVTGFVRVQGRSVGVIANQSMVLAGAIDDAAARKAARFVRLCDEFGIALLSFVDTPGFLPGATQEQAGLARHAGELLAAHVRARVPKVVVVLRQALGAAGVLMGARALGADAAFAWPSARIGLIGVRGAVALGQSQEAAAQALDPSAALASGAIDALTVPRDTRACIARALARPARDHLGESDVL